MLIYCHLGNSGTPLLTSLAQLFLDPFYRTFDGFRCLVHKEWNYYLHNFRKKGLLLIEPGKNGQPQQQQVFQGESEGLFAQGLSLLGVGAKNQNMASSTVGNIDKKVDPIFILFLDAVAQLTKLNPTSFQFAASYPAYIASQLHTNRFFEFVQSESPEDGPPQGLRSIFDEPRHQYSNQVYKPSQATLDVEPKSLELWLEFFGRFQVNKAGNNSSKVRTLGATVFKNREVTEKIIANIKQVE